MAFVLSAVTIAIAVAAVHISEWWFSPGVMILPILAGGLLLWPRALHIYFGFAAAALSYNIIAGKARAGIIATIVVTALFADVLARTREELASRACAGTGCCSSSGTASGPRQTPRARRGVGISLVLRRRVVVRRQLRRVVQRRQDTRSGAGGCVGQGNRRRDRALLLSGALGGLLGSVPREEFLPACNAYMHRGPATEGFVTAVHLWLDLTSGEYVISSAGHPPAVHYNAAAGRWGIARAHGMVFGVVADLHGAATESEHGVLQRGDALMLYTDGMVESPGRDIDAGTDRLLGEAERLLSGGFRAGAPALVAAMQREIGSSDDCALVLIWRT